MSEETKTQITITATPSSPVLSPMDAKDSLTWKIKINDNDHKEEAELTESKTETNFSSLEEAIKEVNRLSSKHDGEKNPFKSKYKARTILQKCLDEWTAKDKASEGKNEEVKEKLGVVQILIGINYIDTDEVAAGEPLLIKAVDYLKSKPTKYALELIDAYNNLGAVWSSRNETEKASQFLNSANDIYSQCMELKKQNAQNLPAVLTDASLLEKLEHKHTLTLFYLAQVFAHLKKYNLAAEYCQKTLNRQLQTKPLPQDWSQNCIGLAFYFSQQKRFRQAGYCLSAAESIFKQRSQDESSETLKANMARMRGQIYLKHLELSHQNLDKKEMKDDEKDTDKLILFDNLNIPEPPQWPLSTKYDEAKTVFQKGLTALNEASEFYVMDGYVSEHIEITQETSALYRHLIAFETDVERKSKMHRRRIALLEPLVENLNVSIYLNYYQQLTDELGRCYADLVELKLAQQHKEARRTMTSVNKLNDLVLKAVSYFQLWLKTFEANGKEPETLDAVYHKSYLTNLFTCARLQSKVFALDAALVCSYLNKSLEGYKKVVQMAEKFQAKNFDEELSICKQMVELLPIKISKINTTGIPFQE